MRKSIKKVVSLGLIFALSAAMNVVAQNPGEDFGNGLIKVKKGCEYKLAKRNIKRTRKFSYVNVKADSVYPTGEGVEDDYTHCRTNLRKNGKLISKEKTVLDEGKLKKVGILQGYQDVKSFDLYFAGNQPDLDAWIAYYYNGN